MEDSHKLALSSLCVKIIKEEVNIANILKKNRGEK